MKIIALPDLHGRPEHISKIADLQSADVILLPGDMTNGPRSQLDSVLKALQATTATILTIPGNMDTLQLVELLDGQGMNIHRKHRVIDGVAFVGVGGSLPFAGSIEYSENELAALLHEAQSTAPTNIPQILVCHQPPINTINDVPRQHIGHVGSTSVRAHIEQVQPLICFTGHIHEGQGIDHIGKTAIVNPGPIWRSMAYAYAEVADGEIKTLEIRDIRGQ